MFVQSKERAKELYKELAFDNIKADVIHADLSQEQVTYNRLCTLVLVVPYNN